MEREKLGKLVLKGLLSMKDGGLVGQNCAHVGPEGLHILADEYAMLLGLILEGLETGSEVEHRVLKDSGGTDRVLPRGRLGWCGMRGRRWWWWMEGSWASATLRVDREAKPSLIVSKLILIRGFIARVIHHIGAWDTRIVSLNHNGLDRVDPRLIIFLGHPGLLAYAVNEKGVAKIHFRIPVMEDGILDNLLDIERDVLEDGIIKQGAFGRHFTHIRRRDETQSDEVMPDLGDVGQMFGLEVPCKTVTSRLPVSLPVGQYPNDLRVVGLRIKLIKGLRRDRFEVIKLVDRLRVEVYQHAAHPNLFHDMGGEIGVEFPYHALRSWTRQLAQGLPSLSSNSFAEEVLGVVKPLFLNEGTVFANEAELLCRTFIDKLGMVICMGGLVTSPPSLSGQLLALTRHRC